MKDYRFYFLFLFFYFHVIIHGEKIFLKMKINRVKFDFIKKLQNVDEQICNRQKFYMFIDRKRIQKKN